MRNEYNIRGEYHRLISKDWSYYPLYITKKEFVINFLKNFKKDIAILDIGCGEGVFIEELKKIGFQKIIGIDKNYSSRDVIRGDILNLPLRENSFDVALLLDVIEHIPLKFQKDAIREIKRILKNNGILIVSVPNLAHLASRIKFFFKGRFIRTASVEKHPGDRPVYEFIELFKKESFKLLYKKGLFPTFPIVYKLIQRKPANFMWLFKLLNIFNIPNLCFLNILILKKNEHSNL